MVNYVLAFSQAELRKYFEWIIKSINAWYSTCYKKSVILLFFQILEALEKDPNDAVTAMDIVKKVYTVRTSTTVIMT